MKQLTTALLGCMTLAFVASACGPSAETPTEPSLPSELPQLVETAVLSEVSERSGVPVDELQVVDAEAVEWPDACLGLANEGEVCAQVITPGWRVTVQGDGQTHTVHTNEDGTAVRVE